jgi:hypothetical protein
VNALLYTLAEGGGRGWDGARTLAGRRLECWWKGVMQSVSQLRVGSRVGGCGPSGVARGDLGTVWSSRQVGDTCQRWGLL